MKSKFSDFASTYLLVACLVAGAIFTASLVTDQLSDQGTLRPSAAVSPLAVGEQVDASAQYVQEPAGRSSFRPDLSRGLRRTNQRGNYAMLRAFNEAVSETRKSTVQLNAGGLQVALGAIVGTDGWIVSKASELPANREIVCQLYDHSQYPAQVVQTVAEIDLALLRIDRSDLRAVQWESASVPNRGSWLATTDLDTMPSAVGVVSAGIQRVSQSSAVLGVNLVDSPAGAAIMTVLPGTGADIAGLQIGDNIVAVNGKQVASHRGFKSVIQHALGGELVTLTVNRADQNFDVDARLMDLSEELRDPTEMEVNGHVSARATGFQRVLLHDTVLEPNQCGGPLCNLDGKVVGINIARAGRVTSYALPADVLRPLLDGLIEQARLVSRPTTRVEQPIR